MHRWGGAWTERERCACCAVAVGGGAVEACCCRSVTPRRCYGIPMLRLACRRIRYVVAPTRLVKYLPLREYGVADTLGEYELQLDRAAGESI